MDWYRNLNAKPRLALGFGILLFLTLIIGVVGIYSLKQAAERVDALYNRDMKGMQAVENIAIFKNDTARNSRDGILQMDNPEILKADILAMKSDMQKIREAIKSAEGCFYTKEGIAYFAELSQTFPEYEKVVEGIIEGLESKNVELAKRNTLIVAGPTAAKMSEQMERLRVTKERASAENFEANQKAYQRTLSIIIGIIVAALVIGAILAIVIANGFSKPLVKTAGVLEKMAEGDLTVALDIDTHDEIGRMASALNRAVNRLNRTMREVAASAAGASSSSQQLASASEAIASGAQEQAASLEETSASLEEITATVRNTADNAQQASQLAAASKESALQGHEVVSAAVTAMSEIDASSAKISDIISTIDEIAFQTNLLAVNAAVEAARAGEEGRGFAVVASEVRSLAQRSAVAAKEIKTLIQDSLRKVESGSALVNRSGETLQGIVNSVKRVTDIVGEIAAAAREQSAGIEQVNSAMTQMDHVTQSNSAQTEELSATAESLSEQAANLLRLIDTFKLTTDEEGVGAQLSAPIHKAASAGPRKIPASKSRFGSAKAKVSFAHAAVAAAVPADSDGSFEEF